MRELVSGLVMFGLLAAASVLAVRFGDRETLVAPPDAVAEQFTRAVMGKRWEPAREYLENPDAVSDEKLAAMQKQLGEGQNVETDIVSSNDEQAVVTVRVPSRGYEKNLSLTFDQKWVIVIRG